MSDLKKLNKMLDKYNSEPRNSVDLMLLVYNAYLLGLDGSEAQDTHNTQCPKCHSTRTKFAKITKNKTQIIQGFFCTECPTHFAKIIGSCREDG